MLGAATQVLQQSGLPTEIPLQPTAPGEGAGDDAAAAEAEAGGDRGDDEHQQSAVSLPLIPCLQSDAYHRRRTASFLPRFLIFAE